MGPDYMTTNVFGSSYSSHSLLGWTNGSLNLSNEAALSATLTNRVLLGDTFTDLSKTNGLRLKVFRSSGLFSGHLVDPATQETNFFQGALLQEQDRGFGSFVNSNQGGEVLLEGEEIGDWR
jgi:hypothetical protein